MVTYSIAPDESIKNPTVDQVISNCIHVDSSNEARLYREAYIDWHKKRSQLRTTESDLVDRNDTHWDYISAKITRSNLLGFVKRTVTDKARRKRLIELFDLNTVPVKPVHFKRQVHAA
ncbi:MULTISPECIES: hypothetical protein [Acinetobacter]|uniref:Uncharacterized protein n=1 Tax=Acinetobacter indicus TaxID=756892 RepID=A0A6C0Y7R8_9GAMM|nr:MULTISPECIES: hypothetical protein [Acinetobacter]QIC71912.1 hypothetical protein FSC09_16100 [Acinetobacter indicus]QKQ71449.1 hypothetical protein E5Y90_14555 [Acinetobacter sp. 10FS3-1]